MQSHRNYQVCILLWSGCLLSFVLTVLCSFTFLLPILFIFGNILIDRSNQCIFSDIKPVGTFRKIGCSPQIVWNHGNAPDDITDSLRALQRVGDILQQEIGLELDEVCLMLFYVFLELLGGMLSGKGVRIVTIRQQQDLDVHAFL